MKGVVVEKAGAPFTVATDVEKPKPGPDQILVKSIATAINPVDTYMQSQGVLVKSFPIVLGCDAAGVVADTGSEAKAKFQPGDEVCGCTRLGFPGHSTFQEYFLMDADLAIPKPKNITIEQAATLGVGIETACLGLFVAGFEIPLVDPKSPPSSKDEWILVLGGAGSVGQYAIQLAKVAGYKVVTSCSSKSAQTVKSLGADAFVDYKKSEDEQVQEIASITGGKIGKVYDTVAKSPGLSKRVLSEVSTLEHKYYATTGDSSAYGPSEGVKVDGVTLGIIGRSGEDIKADPQINQRLASYVPMIVGLVETGKVVPNEYQIAGEGFESISDAVKKQLQSGGAGGKFVVKLQLP